MQAIVGLVYITVLTLVLTYSVGGLGLGVAIFLLLAYIVGSELIQAKHEENEMAQPGPGHHHKAHGGQH